MKYISTKNRIFLLIFVITLISVVIFLVSRSSKKNNSTDTSLPATGASYQNLTPGVSTKEDVFQSLGSSLNEREEKGTRILEYSSNNPNFNNEFSVKNEKLSFVKEIVTLEDNKLIPDIVSEYGDYENILYGPGSGVGFYLYVYSTKGIAYVGHKDSGLIKEIWYFPPTDFESFKSGYATGYSSTIQIIQ